ncbi:MAG TPA: redoxin family protein, partial [Arenimonas sp.]|nr:redoxin family protein [Arenimonas sp.]
RDEHPYIDEIARSGRVRVIGYDYKDDPVDAQRWLQQFGNPYEFIVVDADGLAALDWGIYGAPETFLVDAAGIVRWKHVGPIDRKVMEASLWPALESLP